MLVIEWVSRQASSWNRPAVALVDLDQIDVDFLIARRRLCLGGDDRTGLRGIQSFIGGSLDFALHAVGAVLVANGLTEVAAIGATAAAAAIEESAFFEAARSFFLAAAMLAEATAMSKQAAAAASE